MPNAFFSNPRSDIPQQPIDGCFPDDPLSSNPLAYADPRGPVLDDVLLDHLTPVGVKGRHPQQSLSALLTNTADQTAGKFL